MERFKQSFYRIQWKNDPPPKNKPYQPTGVEHLANILTHGFYIVPAIRMCTNDLLADLRLRSWEEARCHIIYTAVTIGLFTVSTLFHIIAGCGCHGSLREIFHRLDRAMIYLFIAGAYTPWLVLKRWPENGWGTFLQWAIWPFASAGILYQQLFHEKFKLLETIFYLIIGILPSLVVWEMEDDGGLQELKFGGLIYIVGVLFFKLDGRIPFAHAIWHLHVVVASKLHYDAVVRYLIRPPPAESLP